MRIKEYGLENNFLFVNENISLYPVLKSSSIFIRPTFYDSYGISVGEALSIGIPSIASDVCKRTEGAIIFKNRSIDDLYLKVKSVLSNPSRYKDRLVNIKVPDNSEELLNLYKKLLKY
ncbi:glycosyltransferase [Vibrio metschnikovii]|nr:glycosyltransferase [Vibrio metschnikovii]